MSDVIRQEVINLLNKELAEANRKFPMFNSNHEAFAVLLEEVEETKDEMEKLEMLTNNIWIGTKENHSAEALYEQYTATYETAVKLAIEAIQAAAIAKKAILSNIEMSMIEEAEALELHSIPKLRKGGII